MTPTNTAPAPVERQGRVTILPLAEIMARADALAHEGSTEEVRDLASLVRHLAEGLSRGGGACWPEKGWLDRQEQIANAALGELQYMRRRAQNGR